MKPEVGTGVETGLLFVHFTKNSGTFVGNPDFRNFLITSYEISSNKSQLKLTKTEVKWQNTQNSAHFEEF